MKLNEKNIANIFRQHSLTNDTDATLNDALQLSEGSEQRIDVAEKLVSDFNSAQGFRLAFKTKEWANNIAEPIHSKTSRRNIFKFLYAPALAASFIACAVWVSLPYTQNTGEAFNMPVESHVQKTVSHDIIKGDSFDDRDVIGKKSFDSSSSQSTTLFSSSFS